MVGRVKLLPNFTDIYEDFFGISNRKMNMRSIGAINMGKEGVIIHRISCACVLANFLLIFSNTSWFRMAAAAAVMMIVR